MVPEKPGLGKRQEGTIDEANDIHTKEFFIHIRWIFYRYYIYQYIILKDGILRLNSCNISFKQGVYFTVHSLGSIRTKCQGH